MKRPSDKLRRVTPDTLATLGAERLADLLFEVAESRPDLKRRLRMELAAEHGAGALAREIDKRLAAFETSRGKITWRQRPAFMRDIDALRSLIAGRLAALDAAAASERLLRFIDTARQAALRYHERDGELSQVFGRAADDLGLLLALHAPGPAAAALVESLTRNPRGWEAWLPGLLANSQDLAAETLRQMADHRGATPGWISLVRHAADAAQAVDAYQATFTADALRTPAVAAEVARRLLAVRRTEEAGDLLELAAPKTPQDRARNFDWESVYIDYLEASGRAGEAQDARWASFERTLAVERLRSHLARLKDFDDVEAEAKALEIAARHPDFDAGLAMLMQWPALPEAAAMIERRSQEIDLDPETAAAWAAKLRRKRPEAALLLLRRAAAAAFRRRDFKGCDRLTAEAETIAM